MRLQALLLALVLLVTPGLAVADDHKAEGSGRAGGEEGSWLFGVRGTFAWMFVPGHPEFGLVGDVGVSHGEREGEDITRTTVLGGVQWSLPKIRENRNHTVALQALAGSVLTGTGDGAKLAGALGAQWDYLFRGAGEGGSWGTRVQFDYVFAKDYDNFARFSAGVVYKWGSNEHK